MFEDASRKRCPTCNYNLEGLAETRCPECARDFDPDNPTTDCADGPKTWTSASLGLALIASIHLLTLAVSTFDVGFRVPGEWYPLGGCEMDSIGKFATFTSPLILIACMLTRKRSLICIGGADLVLAIIWIASAVRLMSYL